MADTLVKHWRYLTNLFLKRLCQKKCLAFILCILIQLTQPVLSFSSIIRFLPQNYTFVPISRASWGKIMSWNFEEQIGYLESKNMLLWKFLWKFLWNWIKNSISNKKLIFVRKMNWQIGFVGLKYIHTYIHTLHTLRSK